MMTNLMKSQFAYKETSTKYTYKWDLGGSNLDQLLSLHCRLKLGIKSDEIKFNSGILAKVPHRMKIFIDNEGDIVLYFCVKKEIITKSEPTDRTISGLSATCLRSDNSTYSFKLANVDDEYGKGQTNAYVSRSNGRFSIEEFSKENEETGYLFHGLHFYDSENTLRYFKDYKQKRADLTFELVIFHILWNNNNNEDVSLEKHGILQTEPFFMSTKFSDFIIQAGEKDYPVHKIVIASRSPVFERMFEGEFKETMEGRLVIDAECETVEEFLRFIYTGQVDKMEENALGLFVMADKYDISDLKTRSEVALIKSVTRDNFVELFKLGKLYSSDSLMNNCYHHFKKHAAELYKTPEDIKKISEECPDLMLLSVQEMTLS